MYVLYAVSDLLMCAASHSFKPLFEELHVGARIRIFVLAHEPFLGGEMGHGIFHQL